MRVLALGFLLTAAPALGQATRVYATELGRRVLARTDQLVEAEVAYIHPPFRGVSTARLRVKARLHGFDRSEEILLLFIEDYLAPDAFSATLQRSTVSYEHRRKAGLGKYLKDLSRLKVPRAEDEITNARQVKKTVDQAELRKPKRGVGVRLAKGEEGIFFLRRKGASYEMVGYVPNRDPLYKAKRQRLENILRIEAVPALDVRARGAKRFFLAALRSRDPWERGNAARELRVLATRFPEVFLAGETRQLAARLYREVEPRIQASLERALRALDANLALEYARQEEARDRERHADALARERKALNTNQVADLRAADLVRVANQYGRAATPILIDYLADRAAIVRERAAQALAELGGPSSREPLRRALAEEENRHAAMAMIYACGVKGDPDAVPLLASLLTNPELERTCLHALARIATRAARTALERHGARADTATADLIQSLLREEFPEGP
ncbi:MAG: HEAT repeat domain-containing protein [Planctomycetota bacterium]|jgi:HEAT repeat protein